MSMMWGDLVNTVDYYTEINEATEDKPRITPTKDTGLLFGNYTHTHKHNDYVILPFET